MYPQHSPLECVYLYYFVTVPISLLLADIMVEVQKPYTYTLKAVNAKDKGELIDEDKPQLQNYRPSVSPIDARIRTL